MLLELAIGDAYGAGYEFSNETIPAIGNYRAHKKHLNLKPGRYTDDTQMSLAIAECMISGCEWNKRNLANWFFHTFKRDVRSGYSKRFQALLEECTSGYELLAKLVPNSDRCGAAMRSVPIGLFKDIPTVIKNAAIQASITHNTNEGITSSIAVALSSYYFHKEIGIKSELPEFLSIYIPHVPENQWTDWSGFVNGSGMSVARSAISTICNSNSLSEILFKSINYTGDVDSIAAIACGLGSMSSEINKDLPMHLYNGLEDGGFGKYYLTILDCILSSEFYQGS